MGALMAIAYALLSRNEAKPNPAKPDDTDCSIQAYTSVA